MTDSTIFALTSSRERTASTTSGYLMLLLLLLAIAVQVFGIANLVRDNHTALVIAAVVVMPFVILLHRLRLLHAAAQPGRGDHLVRRL